jgi:hypothetical protein
MRERVKQLGGVFDMRSKLKRGTAVCVELPLAEGSQFAADQSDKSTGRDTPLLEAKAATAGS